jgi:serine/threonine-protein kinase PknK
MYVMQTSAMLASFRGDLGRAITLLEAAIPMFRAAGHVMGEVHTRFLLGENLGLAGDAERAAAAHRQCLAMTEPRGELSFRSYSLWALGLDAWRTGDSRRATTHERDALRMKRELDDRLGIALCLEALAWIGATESGERSAILLGAADLIWQAMGFSLAKLPFFSAYRSKGEEAARRALSDRSFQAAFRRGAELSHDQAIALALGEGRARHPRR